MTKIFHYPGRGLLLVRVVFRNTYELKLVKELVVAVGDTYTGQLVQCAAKAELTIGNCKPISMKPAGTVISSVEEKADDRTRLSRTSDTPSMIEGHSGDGSKTPCHFSSGSRNTLMSTCRAVVGIVEHTIGHRT